MKGTTKIGTLCLNGLAIFLTIIFVISIVTMSGNTAVSYTHLTLPTNSLV